MASFTRIFKSPNEFIVPNDSMALGKFQVHETISNLLNLITEFAPSSLSSRRESWSIGNSIILFGVLRLAPPIFCPSRYKTTTPLSQQLPKFSLPHLYKSFVYNLDSANNSYSSTPCPSIPLWSAFVFNTLH